MSKIMIIDDDIHIGNMLEEILHAEGYVTERAFSGTEALMLLEQKHPDLILLDLMLPGLSGEELLPRIEGVPVIVVSAKTEITNKVDLLMGGAVDYITKPFDTRELLARINVALRQSHTAKTGKLNVCGIELDTETLSASAGEISVRLTRTECAILKLLMQNEGRPVGKSAILDRISLDTPDCTERSLKQHVSNIRKKLMSADGKDHIEAVYGIGFMIK